MNDINEPSKKKIKKEEYLEKNKINEIGLNIRANNLTLNTSNISKNYFTYGEFIRIQEEKFSLQHFKEPPAPEVPVSPWLSTKIESDVKR